jgi:hypothetical protein
MLASFEAAHCEEVRREFMAAEHEALAGMAAVHANTAKEVPRVAVEEEATREVEHAAKETAAVARPWLKRRHGRRRPRWR